MEPGKGEFGLFLFDSVLAGHGVHPQPTLNDQTLADLDTILQVLGQIAPADNFELARRIIGPETIKLDSHLSHRRLVVLGVPHLGGFQYVNLEQAVIHTPGAIGNPILMHDPPLHQASPRLWLFAGTGEGPALASALVAMGWHVKLSLVSAVAGRAYAHHPRLEIAIGAIGTPAAIAAALDQALALGDPFQVVVDATHPFACQISADLAEVCLGRSLPLLRLRREGFGLDQGGAARRSARRGPSQGTSMQLLPGLESLAELDLRQDKLLLAIGHRQLARAVQLTPGAVHHARLLPHATSLQQAMAAGLAPNRVACLRPSAGLEASSFAASVEEALVRQWGITTILARQSGGVTEACWRDLAQLLSLELLLLQRPAEPEGVPAYGQVDLLTRLTELIALLPCSSLSPPSPSPGASPPTP
jgi:precorrin-6A/cobalt-precorrin-6A reductase